MKREFKAQLKTNATTLPLGLAFCAAIALFFTIIIGVAANIDGDAPGPAEIGTLFFYIMAGLYSFGTALSNAGMQYNLALRTGATRKTYLAVCLLLNWGISFALLMAGNLWRLVDHGAAALSGITGEGFRVPLFPLPAAGIALGVTLFGMWAGAMMMAHGRRAFAAIWAVMMVVMICSGQVVAALNGTRSDAFARFIQSAAALVARLPLSGWWLLLFAAGLAMALHTWFMLYKLAVQD